MVPVPKIGDVMRQLSEGVIAVILTKFMTNDMMHMLGGSDESKAITHYTFGIGPIDYSKAEPLKYVNMPEEKDDYIPARYVDHIASELALRVPLTFTEKMVVGAHAYSVTVGKVSASFSTYAIHPLTHTVWVLDIEPRVAMKVVGVSGGFELGEPVGANIDITLYDPVRPRLILRLNVKHDYVGKIRSFLEGFRISTAFEGDIYFATTSTRVSLDYLNLMVGLNTYALHQYVPSFKEKVDRYGWATAEHDKFHITGRGNQVRNLLSLFNTAPEVYLTAKEIASKLKIPEFAAGSLISELTTWINYKNDAELQANYIGGSI